MKDQAKVAFATALVFTAGLLIGVWTQRSRPIPPPPIPVMGEFGVRTEGGFEAPFGSQQMTIMRPGTPGESAPRFTGPRVLAPPPMIIARNVSPDQVREAFETMMPKIKAFKEKVDSIEDQFRESLQKILRPDQRQKLRRFQQERPGQVGAFHGCIEPGPFFTTMIIYRPVLENLTAQLNLDAIQQEQLKQLLIDRRSRLLALVDETPPPSLDIGKFVFRESFVHR